MKIWTSERSNNVHTQRNPLEQCAILHHAPRITLASLFFGRYACLLGFLRPLIFKRVLWRRPGAALLASLFRDAAPPAPAARRSGRSAPSSFSIAGPSTGCFSAQWFDQRSRRDLQALLCTVLHRSLSSFFCLKIAKNVAKFCQNFARIRRFSCRFNFYRNFTKSCRINKNYQIFARKW